MCPQGKHCEGYRPPRKGERRSLRQPTLVQKLPAEQRDAVRNAVKDAQAGRCTCEKRKPHWHNWADMPAVVRKLTGLEISQGALHRDYDVFVEQMDRETLGEAAAAKAIAVEMAKAGFEKIPEGALNALSAEVFKIVRRDSTPDERVEALGNLVFLQSKFTTAQASAAKVELEKEKIALSRERLEQMRAKITGVKEAIGGKKKVSNQELQKKLDEIYDLVQPNA